MASSSSKTVIYAALTGNCLIAATKFGAALFTGSSAMMAEGIHSLVDTGNQGLLLYGMRRARRPADERFPFGHGKEIYFWSFVVAILIFAAGAGLSLYEGLHQVLRPRPVGDPQLNYLVLGLALVFEGGAWGIALRTFRRSKGPWGYVEAVQRGKDPSLFVVLFEDSAAILGLLAAAGGVYLSERTGDPVYDGIASLIIGAILAGTAAWLAYETQGLLIGESANRRVVQEIRERVLAVPEVEAVKELLTMHMGPDFILVNIAVRFQGHIHADRMATTIQRISDEIKAAHPEVKRVFIEAES